MIHHWVDRDLLVRVAKLRPRYSFVLIGDAKVDVSPLERLENVFLLGRRPYEHLPAYCAAFDAGLLLFVPGALARNINPIKMYEYLAAGLPVISTRLPEADRFRGPIRIVDNAERFAEACDEVLATHDTARGEIISRVVQHESWASKVEWLSEAIMNRIHPPTSPVSRPTTDVTVSASCQRGMVETVT